MINPRKKSKYWVDDNSILPEIIITPQGNYPILDEAGNPARTVGAIQDINPNAHIYERVNTQPFMDDYIEGETNTAANQRADAFDAQVVPHMGDFVSAATKPLDVLMPSRWVGLLDKDYNGLSVGDRLTRLFDKNNRGLFINDNPYGLFSKQYAEEHPYWAMAGNAAFDITSTPLIWNGANRAYNAGRTVYNTGRNAVRNYNFSKALDADIANTNLVVREPTGARVVTYGRSNSWEDAVRHKAEPTQSIVYTGVPEKYVEGFPTYLGEIWAGPTEDAVLGYARKNGKIFPIRYDTNNARIIDVDSNGRVSIKGIKLSDVPEDILKLYNEAGILESPVYMSLYNLSKFANKIRPTVIRAKNVKDAKKGIFDYTIIGENVPREIVSPEEVHKVVTPDMARRYGIDSGIDIVGATTPTKINFKISDDIIRRLQRLGIDTNKRVYIKAPWNSEETFMLPSEYLKLNMRMPNLLERNPEFVGTYYPRKGTVTLDSTSPQERLYLDLTHERVGHGTEKLVFNYPEAKQVYSDFANPFREFLEPYRLGDNYIIGGQEIPVEYLSDHELRSTIKELEHQIRVSKNPINAKDFERIVDEIPEEELLNMLKTTNAYGLTYYQMRELVEGFADKLKNLIKYAPAAIPVGIVGTNK